MQYFDFSRLIKKYSVPFTAQIETQGEYDAKGEYKPKEPKTYEFNGTIISLKEDKIYRSEGMLTSNDRQLYMLSPIENSLLGAKVIYQGKTFTIMQDIENAMFTGVYTYLLKHVSAF